MNYVNTADELVRRIEALIPTNPQILEIEDAFKLFRIPGFDYNDLEPTLYQASWALQKAKQNYREKQS